MRGPVVEHAGQSDGLIGVAGGGNDDTRRRCLALGFGQRLQGLLPACGQRSGTFVTVKGMRSAA